MIFNSSYNSEPSIEQSESHDENSMRWCLKVPNVWLLQQKNPRLTIILWLIRLAWREVRKP